MNSQHEDELTDTNSKSKRFLQNLDGIYQISFSCSAFVSSLQSHKSQSTSQTYSGAWIRDWKGFNLETGFFPWLNWRWNKRNVRIQLKTCWATWNVNMKICISSISSSGFFGLKTLQQMKNRESMQNNTNIN